ncbi:hypothetical protein BB560_000962 [Smittium megazygosporum]|uniref:Thiopurine S-methyltransferase n=1 Tax=Smittium megazygosporum TaxID=133381 RepID=A0A2T9ZIX8_9FUNG|nr:hypothetical protein BB560_000962 [Smittium megazygosporum]
MSEIKGRNVKPESWQETWEKGETPWDRGASAPGLIELIEDEKFDVGSGPGLVPGCGRGYDVIYFAQRGHDMYGLDVSKTAMKLASEYAERQVGKDSPVLDRMHWLADSFFEFSEETKAIVPKDGFQFAYDCTFLCALHPTMREDWALQYSKLIKQNGFLVTFMFPLEPRTDDPPPFTLSEELYHTLLDPYFELVHINRNPKKSPSRDYKTHIAVWKRK